MSRTVLHGTILGGEEMEYLLRTKGRGSPALKVPQEQRR